MAHFPQGMDGGGQSFQVALSLSEGGKEDVYAFCGKGQGGGFQAEGTTGVQLQSLKLFGYKD